MQRERRVSSRQQAGPVGCASTWTRMWWLRAAAKLLLSCAGSEIHSAVRN